MAVLCQRAEKCGMVLPKKSVTGVKEGGFTCCARSATPCYLLTGGNFPTQYTIIFNHFCVIYLVPPLKFNSLLICLFVDMACLRAPLALAPAGPPSMGHRQAPPLPRSSVLGRVALDHSDTLPMQQPASPSHANTWVVKSKSTTAKPLLTSISKMVEHQVRLLDGNLPMVSTNTKASLKTRSTPETVPWSVILDALRWCTVDMPCCT